jgi:hypothetical protein
VTFLSKLALAVALLVIVPYLAHRLRRKRAEDQDFPPARLVPPAPPRARRRSRLEDRALLLVRASSVLMLAALGATPLVRCSRLSLQRSGGGSIAMALVVDDSMSMRADAGGRSRFERARQGARELLASARDGDAVAVVLAGAPARVALAATTDLRAARDAVDGLVQSDRATDLDGAVALAGQLVSSLPQGDPRVVVLSDLTDGQPTAPPLGEASSVPVWSALTDLAEPPSRGGDCAVMRADRSGARVRTTLACGPGATLAGRDVVVETTEGKGLGRAPAGTAATGEVSIGLGPDAARLPLRTRLDGSDAIAADDVAPVVVEAGRGAVGVIAEPGEESVATGGAPIAEQALAALKADVDVRPLPSFPERAEELAGFVGVLVDDPPGMTPEQRHALGSFLRGGGLVLLALGPHAAAAPLGATLEPVIGAPIAWRPTSAAGADPTTAVGSLAESAASWADLGAPRRATLAPEDAAAFEPLVRWTDGELLAGRRAMGRGEAWSLTLPLSVDTSDLALRPAFLTMLDEWLRTARDRAVAERHEVGVPWRFRGVAAVDAEGPAGPVEVVRGEEGPQLTPALLGSYRVVLDGREETRVAAPAVRELDLRPRRAASGARAASVGERRGTVDVSGQLALMLLAAFAIEMAIRSWPRRRAEAS